MRQRLTSAWTDAHLWMVVAAVTLVALTSLTNSTSHSTPLAAGVTLVTLVVAFVVASLTDAFGGMLIGLVAAAVFTALHQYLPELAPVGFLVQALTMGLLLLLGLSSGLVSDRIRRGRRIAARQGGQAVAPVPGSLGLISAVDAEWILEEERARAELHGRSLTTARIEVAITDSELADDDVRRARRSVARALETELRVTDVIFLATDGTFGVVMPETTPEGAEDIIESALILARSATFADRAAGTRRPLGDVADLVVTVAGLVPTPTPAPTKTARRTTTKRRGKPSAKAS